MIVVCNTSPIINLAAIGHLTLLQQLYARIIIPEAVYHEIAVIGSGQPGATEVQTLEWIEKQHLAERALVNVLQIDLDAGEAEALALAVEAKADLLLMDERRGRTAAARLGLKYIGLLGVLVVAKQRGLVTLIKPALDELIIRAGFWITKDLYARVLATVGE
jgi:predicted nucleic acid-binding protein